MIEAITFSDGRCPNFVGSIGSSPAKLGWIGNSFSKRLQANTCSIRGGGNTFPISVEEALEARGSVTFRKTPLSEVVFLLSDLWHINIVAGENVSGEVSGSFHNAPLREVLSAVLTSSGYSYRKTGSSLVVLTADQVGTDDPSFRIRYASDP